MNLKLLFIPLTIFWANNTVFATEHNLQNLHQEIETFFSHYLDHYNDYIHLNNQQTALLKAANDLNTPSFQIPPESNIMLFQSLEQIKNNTEYFLDQFKDNGIVKINWQKIQIKVLNPQTAIASNIATLFKSHNYIAQKVAATYLLHKSANQWKIIVRALHPIENSPTFN